MTEKLTNEETVTFTLNGEEKTAVKGELIIEACEKNGEFIPRFCYHPRMKPVGMCRMCLVEVSSPRGPSLQPSCYVEIQNGMEVNTQSDPVKKAQDGVLEYLLLNHPLDCPVCDKGGECPLQDQTLSYGPGESRFIEEKRHFLKPLKISSLVELDRERCIQCGRCIRFAKEISGEAEIDFAGRGEDTEVAIFPGKEFDSYFSLNTVQICPVGALTAVPYRFKSRPWDLEQIESTCQFCAVQCKLSVQSSQNEILRTLGIDSDAVNQSWLCDRGRFGFEAIYSSNRVNSPKIKKDGEFIDVSWPEAVEEVARALSVAKIANGPDSIGFIGGARLNNEGAYAFSKLAKGVIGTDNVDAQLSDGIDPNLIFGLRRATINDLDQAEIVVTLCGDLREELPVLFLRLRTLVANEALLLAEFSIGETPLSQYAAFRRSLVPGKVQNLLEELKDSFLSSFGRDDFEQKDGGIVFVVGNPGIGIDGLEIEHSIRALAKSFPNAKFLPALRRGNIFGALDMGLSPGLLPGRVTLKSHGSFFGDKWVCVPEKVGMNTKEMLQSVIDGTMDTLILLGSDPISDFPDKNLVLKAFEKAKNIICVESIMNESTKYAQVILPASMDHERAGTVTNLEGRVTHAGDKVTASGASFDDWVIASLISAELGDDLGFNSREDIGSEICSFAPAYRSTEKYFISGNDFGDGVVVPIAQVPVSIRARKSDPIEVPGLSSIERQGSPIRSGNSLPSSVAKVGSESQISFDNSMFDLNSTVSYKLLEEKRESSFYLVLEKSLYDNGTLLRESKSFENSARESYFKLNPVLLAELGVNEGDMITVSKESVKVKGRVVADSLVSVAVVVASWNQNSADSRELVSLDNVNIVEVER